MRRIGFVASLFAWAAFLLPWERCESACHDRVLPQVGAHACHAGDERCHDETDCCGAHEDEDDHDARHSAVDFLTVRPDGTPQLPAALPAAAAPEPPLVASAAVHASAEAPELAPPRATVVLLL